MDHAHNVWIDGQLLPPDRAVISVFDAAVMLGDTIAESTRTFGHQPFNGLPVGDGAVGLAMQRLSQAWSELVGLDIAAQGLAQMERTPTP